MEFKYTTWTIADLIGVYDRNEINLNPSYQRNPIWSSNAQKMLLNTIKNKQPIPNFFIRKLKTRKYEMVDGQQRARTIIGYVKGKLTDLNGNKCNEEENFLSYPLCVTLIERISASESIEQFYALVNSSGLRLNRPELKKAEYYDTKFLALITNLAASPEFSKLQLFTESSTNRMNDVEFVSELVANSKFGISEKKEKVDKFYEKDISEEESKQLQFLFLNVMKYIKNFDSIYPINKTRYKQRNDFYTLFDFIKSLEPTDTLIETMNYYYKILLKIGPHIKPSQEECEPFMNYAINCVSQSNSKNAREERKTFFNDLFLNAKNKPNETQRAILKYFGVEETELIKKAENYTIKLEALPDI